MRAEMIGCLALAAILGFIEPTPAMAEEDPKTAVIGKWESNDGDRIPLELFKDGAAKSGFIKQNGKWLIMTGKYTVSDKGRVEFTAEENGISIKSFWTLKDGVLIGSYGPKPVVKWVKVKEEKKK